MEQKYEQYTDQELLVWKTLFERQKLNLEDKACLEHLDALKSMYPVLNENKLPDFRELNEWFSQNTNWRIHCVPGLIPVEEFFDLLAERKFCSSTWLRKMSQLDYLEEPDMFHDIFGHIPLLSMPEYSEFMVNFGKLGAQFKQDPLIQIQLQRLYWYTIEFGLIKQNGVKIYGAGIVSSFGESNSSVAIMENQMAFDLENILDTDFKNDEIQNRYFVIDNFSQLFESIEVLTQKWKKDGVEISR